MLYNEPKQHYSSIICLFMELGIYITDVITPSGFFYVSHWEDCKAFLLLVMMRSPDFLCIVDAFYSRIINKCASSSYST